MTPGMSCLALATLLIGCAQADPIRADDGVRRHQERPAPVERKTLPPDLGTKLDSVIGRLNSLEHETTPPWYKPNAGPVEPQ